MRDEVAFGAFGPCQGGLGGLKIGVGIGVGRIGCGYCGNSGVAGAIAGVGGVMSLNHPYHALNLLQSNSYFFSQIKVIVMFPFYIGKIWLYSSDISYFIHSVKKKNLKQILPFSI